MAVKFTNGIDLDKTSILSAVLHPVSSDPSSPVDGQIWYRTDTDRLRIRANGASQDLAILDDVTAGSITGALWNAQTVVTATADDTPVATTIGEDEVVGRIAGGNIGAVTAAQLRTLLGIEAGATADQTASEIKTAYEGNADTNAYNDAAVTKLAGIEAAADVTDTANVTAAGALMDSEVDADIKTLSLPGSTTISAFGATLIDDAAAVNARATLGLTIGTNVQAYSAVLAATTASFLTADETKLDGIEAGATADQTAAQILAALLTVDGPGSALDADTLDGTQLSALATTVYVDGAISDLIGGASAAYDTLVELQTELEGNDTDIATILAAQALKTDKYAVDIGDGIATAITVTHNLGTTDVVWSLKDTATLDAVIADVDVTTSNTITVTFAVAPASAAYRCVVIG